MSSLLINKIYDISQTATAILNRLTFWSDLWPAIVSGLICGLIMVYLSSVMDKSTQRFVSFLDAKQGIYQGIMSLENATRFFFEKLEGNKDKHDQRHYEVSVKSNANQLGTDNYGQETKYQISVKNVCSPNGANTYKYIPNRAFSANSDALLQNALNKFIDSISHPVIQEDESLKKKADAVWDYFQILRFAFSNNSDGTDRDNYLVKPDDLRNAINELKEALKHKENELKSNTTYFLNVFRGVK